MVFFKTMIATLVFFSFSVHAADYKAPRGPGGVHPDLNGIWQALNTANYDIEMHTASHSMQLREGPHGPLPAVKTLYLGAVGAVPPGLGVVVGGKIPYTPEALAKKQENKANWIDRDPEVEVLYLAFLALLICPSRFRSSKALTQSLWLISMRVLCAKCTWKIQAKPR